MLTLKHPDFARFPKENVEEFVIKQQALGNDVRWDNYDLVFFRPDPRGVYSLDGAFRNNSYGFENIFTVDSDGTWKVDYKNVRRPRSNSTD